MTDHELFPMDRLIIMPANGGTDLSIPKPFEQEIFLFHTYIAGVKYVEGIMSTVKNLQTDDYLEFFREVTNAYDSQAIVIKDIKGNKLGYVPKKDNQIFARLMDAGKLLIGKITSFQHYNNWVKIEIDIFLKE